MHLAHTAIWVEDLDRTLEFYEAIGLRRRWSFVLDGVENVYLGDDDRDALQLRHDPDRTTPIAPTRADVDHVALAVDDVDGTYEAAIGAGASAIAEPRPLPEADGYVAFLEDPDGYTLELVAPLD